LSFPSRLLYTFWRKALSRILRRIHRTTVFAWFWHMEIRHFHLFELCSELPFDSISILNRAEYMLNLCRSVFRDVSTLLSQICDFDSSIPSTNSNRVLAGTYHSNSGDVYISLHPTKCLYLVKWDLCLLCYSTVRNEKRENFNSNAMHLRSPKKA
jgi:hypothetical protein